MKLRTLLLIQIIFSVLSFNLRQTKEKQYYDSLVLALNWPNGYGRVNGNEADIDKMKLEDNIFTIHGLWPALKSGALLNDCTTGVIINEDSSELFKKMKKYWPNLKDNKNVLFWKHEYNKHGDCMVEEKNWSGYRDYFQHAMDLYLKDYRLLLQKALGIKKERKIVTITFEEIKEKIQKIIPDATFKMNCKSGIVYEFYFYLTKNLTPSTTSYFSNSCRSAKLIFK